MDGCIGFMKSVLVFRDLGASWVEVIWDPYEEKLWCFPPDEDTEVRINLGRHLFGLNRMNIDDPDSRIQ